MLIWITNSLSWNSSKKKRVGNLRLKYLPRYRSGVLFCQFWLSLRDRGAGPAPNEGLNLIHKRQKVISAKFDLSDNDCRLIQTYFTWTHEGHQMEFIFTIHVVVWGRHDYYYQKIVNLLSVEKIWRWWPSTPPGHCSAMLAFATIRRLVLPQWKVICAFWGGNFTRNRLRNFGL